MRQFSLAVGATAFIAYLLLAPSVSGMGDSSEWTLVLATNGVAHPTGYPLYTLLGHLSCRLLHAFGVSWPSAANAWSALGGAIAVALLHAVTLELTEAGLGMGVRTRQFVALLPTALFAVQPITLREATAAEVNIWSAAWTCGAGYAFVRLLRGIESSQIGRASCRERV